MAVIEEIIEEEIAQPISSPEASKDTDPSDIAAQLENLELSEDEVPWFSSSSFSPSYFLLR